MREEIITCDGCRKDISKTDEMPSFRLRLSAEKMRQDADFSYAILITPPIVVDHHFCGLNCLQTWMERINRI